MLTTMSMIAGPTLDGQIGADPLFLTTPINVFDSLPTLDRARVAFARQQASLPTTMGGVGVGTLLVDHPACYVASWAATLKFIDNHLTEIPIIASIFDGKALSQIALSPLHEIRIAWDSLTSLISLGDDSSMCTTLKIDCFDDLRLYDCARPQHALSDLAHKAQYCNMILTAPTPNDKIRLLSCSGVGGAGWLRAIPFCPLTTLSNFQFRAALLFRLGLPLPCHSECVRMPTCGPNCHGPVDQLGYHDHACPYSTFIPRHEAFLRALRSILRRAGIENSVSTHERAAHLRHLLGQQQSDLVLHNFRGQGADAHLDITVIHPINRSYASLDYLKPGDAVSIVRADSKSAQYSEIYNESPQAREHGTAWLVFGAETFGSLDPLASSFFNDFIVPRYVQSQGCHPDSVPGLRLAEQFRTQSFAQISIAIQSTNADIIRSAVVRRHPSSHSTLLNLIAQDHHGMQISRTKAWRTQRKGASPKLSRSAKRKRAAQDRVDGA